MFATVGSVGAKNLIDSVWRKRWGSTWVHAKGFEAQLPLQPAAFKLRIDQVLRTQKEGGVEDQAVLKSSRDFRPYKYIDRGTYSRLYEV